MCENEFPDRASDLYLKAAELCSVSTIWDLNLPLIINVDMTPSTERTLKSRSYGYSFFIYNDQFVGEFAGAMSLQLH